MQRLTPFGKLLCIFRIVRQFLTRAAVIVLVHLCITSINITHVIALFHIRIFDKSRGLQCQWKKSVMGSETAVCGQQGNHKYQFRKIAHQKAPGLSAGGAIEEKNKQHAEE